MLTAHGGNPAGWTRLTGIGRDSLAGWPRFLRQHKLTPEAQRFASTYVPPTWWTVRYVHTTGTEAQRTEEWRVRLWPDGRPLDVRHLVPDSARGNSADSAAVRRIALATLVREGIDTSALQESELKETARPARRDATVTYTDTSVKLPDGATARAWVQIAGDEPLVVRRGVELPETFLRADSARQTNRMVIAVVSILVLIGLVATGALVVKRRRPIVVTDGALNRRAMFILVATLVLLGLLGSLNSLPSQLFRYNTVQPWDSFLATTALSVLITIPAVLLVVGLWLALGAMRRRVGIPMLASDPSRSARNDMLIAGLGIGGVIYTMTQLNALVARRDIPRAPTTALEQAWPVFVGITDLPANALMIVALVGIPILVIAGLTARWTLRTLGVAILVALLGAVAWGFGSGSSVDPIGLTLLIASVAIISAAIVAWGTLSAWSWIVAALINQALSGLRTAVYAPVWQERGAGILALLVASALVALIARRVTANPSDH
jgi:hypothetical protein